MRRALKACVVLAAVTIIWAPAQARADGYVSPWVAANSGAGFESGNVFDNGRAGFGVTAGAMIVGIPVGGSHGSGIRPYVTAGLGLIRTQVDGGILFPVSSSNNDFGWNAGLGVM